MSDFVMMRQNMVRNQILPEEVRDPFLLKALLTVPRERFVPRQLARIAYMDTNFPVHSGRVLLRPAVLARLLEALLPTPIDKILYIGGGIGYGPALLGQMGLRVFALDSEEALTQESERLLHELKLTSVEVVLGPLVEGWREEAPYDKIIIEGAVEYIPKVLFHQLKDEGQLVTLKYQKKKENDAVRYIKKDGILTEISLFDAFAPRLDVFRQPKAFVF